MADWLVYCDESSHGGDCRFMAYGGVAIEAELAERTVVSVERWRRKHNFLGEMHWSATAPGLRLRAHKDFATGVIRMVQAAKLRFGCVVFDTHDEKLFRGQSLLDRRRSMALDFVLHCFAIRLQSNDRMWLFPDEGMIRCDRQPFIDEVNSKRYWRRPSKGYSEVLRCVAPQHSHESNFIQMADVLTGAIAGANNNGFSAATKRGAAKKELLEHIMAEADLNPLRSTPQGHDFDLWHYVPRKKDAAKPLATRQKPRLATGNAQSGVSVMSPEPATQITPLFGLAAEQHRPAGLPISSGTSL